MIKIYKANTNISINVVLPSSKKNLHIAFVPMSDGSSVFSTDNEEIQKGIERHYKYGIRYLDPPLHEFLPKTEEEVRELASDLNVSISSLHKKIDSLKEFNPKAYDSLSA